MAQWSHTTDINKSTTLSRTPPGVFRRTALAQVKRCVGDSNPLPMALPEESYLVLLLISVVCDQAGTHTFFTRCSKRFKKSKINPHETNMAATYAQGLSQQDMMMKDECIVVDGTDLIIGHGSKLDVHTVTESTSRGKLHRAFSVFLFDSKGRLLLQQRAASKITFPNVWTNTCCSHPLYGFEPAEVDDDASISNGTVLGAKNAAIRKLNHELGVSFKELDVKDFKFLTRLHYYAPDVVTHGPNSPWCEHEIDYILFMQKDVKIKANREEVGDTKYVDLKQLQTMMDPASGLLWSPWFRIIAEKFLVHWWEDLPATLSTNIYVNCSTIYKCLAETGELVEVTANNASVEPAKDTNLKQGAYGKVKIHKHSLSSQLLRVDEVASALYLLAAEKFTSKLQTSNADLLYCDEMLGKVSRSFAGVIRQLPGNLYVDILLFYLVLRALDTVEDDMEVFLSNGGLKVTYLHNFYRTFMIENSGKYSLLSIGQGDERALLQHYNHCVNVYHTLPKASQVVIADICERMGKGMASFVSSDLGQGTVTVKDYDLYCHYVAGLVGEGLSELFYANGYESIEVKKVSKTKANTMGLFLQKTNIIRDYLEDYCEGRTFWPQEIWTLYTRFKDLGELRNPENREKSMHCLNHMVLNALECIPECLEYMELLRHRQVFLFCAIPQVMAIATLAEIFNNPKVFTGVVKIRKGLAAKMILDVSDNVRLHKWFYVLTKSIRNRIPQNDPNSQNLEVICKKVMDLTREKARIGLACAYAQVASQLANVVILFCAYSLSHKIVPTNGTLSQIHILFFYDTASLTNDEYLHLVLLYCSVGMILIYAVLETMISNYGRK